MLQGRPLWSPLAVAYMKETFELREGRAFQLEYFCAHV